MTGAIFLILAAILIGAAVFGKVAAVSQVILLAAGLAALVLGTVILVITRLYQKTSSDVAFVRTGMGGERAVIGGGALVFPVLHKIRWVPLKTIKLEVDRVGQHALITKDRLRADVEAQFYINVPREPQSVLAAARTVGDRFTQAVVAKRRTGEGEQDEKEVAGAVQELIKEKLDSALRQVAAVMELFELQTNREQFTKGVEDIVRSDIAANGFNLESATITKLDQTDIEFLSEANVFDAEGRKKIAEITQEARVRTNEIERQAEIDITRKNVETRKAVLEQDRDQATAEATQKTEVVNIQAQRGREAAEFKIVQDRDVERARIESEQAVQQADIQRQRQIILAQQEQQTTDVTREQAVAVADRAREIAIAEAEERRAAAQAKQLRAQAEREQAGQAVRTVEVTAQAEREASVKVINATAEADQARVQKEKQADAEAYAMAKVAEGRIQAAENEAKATRTRAEADRDAARLAAEGQTAQQMVPVEIDRERVRVSEAQVAVDRQALENKQTFERAALDFEKAKLQIEAAKEVQVAAANALGSMMASAKMNIFGDPTTLSLMSERFLKAAGYGVMVEGFLSSVPQEAKEKAAEAAGGVGSTISGLIESLTGKKIKAEVIDEVVQSVTGARAEEPAED